MNTIILKPKLSIELVPSTCWYSNVRTNVSSGEWQMRVRVPPRARDCNAADNRPKPAKPAISELTVERSL